MPRTTASVPGLGACGVADAGSSAGLQQDHRQADTDDEGVRFAASGGDGEDEGADDPGTPPSSVGEPDQRIGGDHEFATTADVMPNDYNSDCTTLSPA